jgi:DNA (cytosine-5)-methyltransferase 3A
MNVLSLFDGMSCGQIALQRAGIKVDNYFASEIKPQAIKCTQFNFPNTIQIGSVIDVKGSSLPKIDLLIGGSPCQDFSQANKERKGLNGTKSRLFFEYKRILEETSPKYFLLENVEMGDENIQILSDYMGCYPVNINSELVSAQFRSRYYWTNINGYKEDLFCQKYTNIPQPANKKIKLQDILEDGFTDKIKSRSLNTKQGISEQNIEGFYKRYTTTGMVTAIFKSQDLDYKKGLRHFTQTELEKLQTLPIGYTKMLSKNAAWNLIGDGWTIDVIAHIFKYLKQKQ